LGEVDTLTIGAERQSVRMSKIIAEPGNSGRQRVKYTRYENRCQNTKPTLKSRL